MTYPTLTDGAAAIGINRTTLIEQLHRLEADIGAPLYHRATRKGGTQRPTRRGAALLQTLARPDIQPLRATRARLPRLPAGPSESGADTTKKLTDRWDKTTDNYLRQPGNSRSAKDQRTRTRGTYITCRFSNNLKFRSFGDLGSGAAART
jgi:hypothetical protein